MRKKIGIIYDDKHPLLAKIIERLEATDTDANLIHYRSLPFTFGRAHPLEGYSAIYLDRMGEKTSSYTTQLELLSHWQTLDPNLRIVNRPLNYANARNKALAALTLNARHIKTPLTRVVYTWQQLAEFHGQVKSERYVVKSNLGCCANEVHLYPSDGNRKAIEDIFERDGMALIQPFVSNPGRFIWRVDTVNGDVIVCNQRFAFNDSDEAPLCNGTRGGDIRFLPPHNLPPRVRDLALRAVQCLGLTVAGTDIIESDDGSLYVIEVNPEPDITLDRYEFPYSIANYLRSL
jgi:glutathione synthase/RimK-type ligase-like ATP-grasp enzyme